MKKQILLSVLALSLGINSFADHRSLQTPAIQTIDIVSWWGFKVGVGETVSRKMDRPLYVESIVVQAEGYSSRDGMMDVMVNGKVKGTIYVPGRDPSYVVTIAEETASIEFRHTSGGGVSVRDVKVTVNNQKTSRVPSLKAPLNFPARNEAMAIARDTIAIIDQLQDSMSGSAFDAYLLPIKKAAAMLYAKANANGDLSTEVLKALQNLDYQMSSQKQYIESALAVGSTFELGVALLSVHEKVQATLR